MKLSAGHGFELGRSGFAPWLAAVWLDDKYVDYYYGIEVNEAIAGRRFYAPKATVNLEAGVRTTFHMTPRNPFFLSLSVDSLGSEIKDGPIVDGSTESRVFAGCVHMF